MDSEEFFDQLKDERDRRETEWSGPGLGQHLVSEAQRRANRANAQSSSGPRSAGGKAEAARNALRHGLYATTASAIPRGALKENPDDVEKFLQDRIECLSPRDAIEVGFAAEIARVMLTLSRLDAYGAQLLGSDGKRDPILRKLGIHEPDERVLRHLADSAEYLVSFLQGPKSRPASYIDYEACAKLIRYQRKNLIIRNLWSDEVTPQKPAEWKRALLVLVKRGFKNEEEALEWAILKAAEFREDLEVAKDQRYETAASRAVNRTFDVIGRHRAKALPEIERLLKIYWFLQERPLAEDKKED